MKPIVPFAALATIIGFVAVYMSLSLQHQGDSISDSINETKTKQMRSQRLRAFITHKEPKKLPNFEFKDEFGKTLRLSDFAGKVLVLNLWATWCGPCREEMPSLDQLKAYFSHEAFDVVAISHDRGGLEKPRAFYAKERLKHLALYIDTSSKLMFQLKAVGLPATLLIDKEGREIGRLPGPAQWDSPMAIEIVKKALKTS